MWEALFARRDPDMSTTEYQFVTHWRVQGSLKEVYDILTDTSSLVRWWPSVYLDVAEVEDDEHESVYEMYTTGWLPYTLRWRLHPVERTPNERIEIEATGDLAGRGVWTFVPAPTSTLEDPQVDVTYEWSVRANKPLLRWFSFLLKPVFAANHHWAMAMGEESLRLELTRRRAPTESARARIPAPPGPTTTSSRPVMVLALVLFAAYAVVRLRRGK